MALCATYREPPDVIEVRGHTKSVYRENIGRAVRAFGAGAAVAVVVVVVGAALSLVPANSLQYGEILDTQQQ